MGAMCAVGCCMCEQSVLNDEILAPYLNFPHMRTCNVAHVICVPYIIVGSGMCEQCVLDDEILAPYLNFGFEFWI